MEFEVEHYHTGELIEHNVLLKQLTREAGVTRNEWHRLIGERAKSEKRSIGQPTKLSEIFSGKRDLPLRDIVFAFEELKLGARETEHYICEYMKAYLPKSTRKFVKPTKWNSSNDKLKLQISVLQDQISHLRQRQTFISHFDINNPLHPLSKNKLDLTPLFPIDPTEIDSRHEIHDWIDKSRIESQKYHFETIKRWLNVPSELEQLKDDPKLRSLVLYCIERDITQKLEYLLDESVSSLGSQTPEGIWSWTRHQPALIPTDLFVARLFNRWKEKFPDEYHFWENRYLEYQENHYLEDNEVPEGYLGFAYHLPGIFEQIKKRAPNLYHFFCPIQDSLFIDYSQLESRSFYLHREYLSVMNPNRVSFDEFLASLWPSYADSNRPITDINDVILKSLDDKGTTVFHYSVTTE
ncbi:hypothetical protein OPS25_01320 [Alteromonas ponticola]|uniref:Uncharacterized protein n=1 Tax=Alteromonas aquimaris TaxID=2998417 RepID=A0ABT3P2Z0_9ALTE|nr:hypothetical protein [Alteromonas aquimaris]MCW8107142.1 hypothetical protein [Alteromonas aquimaris]